MVMTPEYVFTGESTGVSLSTGTGVLSSTMQKINGDYLVDDWLAIVIAAKSDEVQS